jgi:hypothetical protein
MSFIWFPEQLALMRGIAPLQELFGFAFKVCHLKDPFLAGQGIKRLAAAQHEHDITSDNQ